MAWVNAVDAYIDHWDQQLGNRRWYRKHDLYSATYKYIYNQDNPAESTLFGPAGAVGLPAGLDNAGFLITDDTAGRLYDTALRLTVDLSGVLLDTGQHLAAVQAQAGPLANAGNDAVKLANERRDAAAVELVPAERNRLTRQGLRALLDIAAQTTNWVGPNLAVVAPYRNRLLSVSARITAIVNPLYMALL